ncbi:MAG: DUF4230 domain-containing protein [Bacteroidaceae bacterium]|jgi:hypothetical protein|nr:DUF4230 domain-containing protein [Bacteroidaceae bacterium]
MNPIQQTNKNSGWKWVLLLILVLIAVVVLWMKSCNGPILDIETSNPENKILISPEEIRSIEDIGQWVFLNVESEEIVDTTRRHFFRSDDALSRIYVCNMRFGIDMNEVKGTDWFITSGDTAKLALPAVRLMDEDFINEAKTRTFYEVGDWDSQALKKMYNKARRQMLKRNNTSQNLKIAQENAQHEITRFIQSFGFKEVEISFGMKINNLLPPKNHTHSTGAMEPNQ